MAKYKITETKTISTPYSTSEALLQVMAMPILFTKGEIVDAEVSESGLVISKSRDITAISEPVLMGSEKIDEAKEFFQTHKKKIFAVLL